MDLNNSIMGIPFNSYYSNIPINVMIQVSDDDETDH